MGLLGHYCLCLSKVLVMWFFICFFRKGGALLNPLEAMYLLGLIPLELICEFVYPLTVWQKTFPFLPLMLTSVYCALGVTYAFIRLYLSLLTCSDTTKKIKKQWIVWFRCWRLFISEELDKKFSLDQNEWFVADILGFVGYEYLGSQLFISLNNDIM